MRRIALHITAVAAVCALGATAGSASARPQSSAAGTEQTIVGVAGSSPQFTTLVKLVKQAGLGSALGGQTQLTVFAPTNAAFSKVPKATLAALAQDRTLLRKVLLYHVVKGRVSAAKVVRLSSAKTLAGPRIAVAVRAGSVYLNGTTRVTKTDVAASNGLIHVVNKVLLPPS
jgi:uncharacterized surface protein with fasciclin (FAS1) repeats